MLNEVVHYQAARLGLLQLRYHTPKAKAELLFVSLSHRGVVALSGEGADVPSDVVCCHEVLLWPTFVGGSGGGAGVPVCVCLGGAAFSASCRRGGLACECALC